MSDSNLSAIDKAINQAKAKKALKNGEAPTASDGATGTTSSAAPKRVKMSDEEKKARDEKRAAERAEAKAKRDASRDEKRALKAATKTTPHMSKVEKARAKLPAMNAEAQKAFDDITANFAASQVTAIAEHLQHFNRSKATERALAQKLNVGDTVTIVSGDAKYIGQSGTISKAQRIRCYVDVPGANKPVYLFTSDVEVTKVAKAANA